MLKLKSAALLMVAFFVLSPLSPVLAIGVPGPTILSARAVEDGSAAAVIVSGVSAANTEVLVYLDNKYVGTAENNREGTGTDNFYLSINEGLSAGAHRVSAVARDKTSMVLSPMSEAFVIQVRSISAPTMIAPNERTVTAKAKPVITGLVKSGSKVHIYIDGELNGTTAVLNHPSGTANFAYKPFLNLSARAHAAWAIAEDKSGRKSPVSNVLNFRIEQNYPAPWLIKPVVNGQSSVSRPYIIGLAKNDSQIKVYVDHKLNGQFTVKNHPSGTANFAYLLARPLAPGRHLVYATATDKRGKESLWSNVIYYTVPLPQITPEAAEEKQPVVKGESGPLDNKLVNLIALAKLFEKGQEIDLSASQLVELGEYIKRFEELGVAQGDRSSLRNLLNAKKAAEDKKSATSTDATGTTTLEELLKQASDGQVETSTTGLLNESKERQSRLRWNLAIFILFLIAVIVWIFWVNRELIKEKQEQNKDIEKK